MERDALSRLRADFVRAPGAHWGAALCAVGAAVTLAALLVLLYLFVDLLVWRGEVPGYAQLTAAQKREFAAEWAARPDADRADAVARLGASDPSRAKRLAAKDEDELKALAGPGADERLTADEWEARWRANVSLALRERVNAEAADAYLAPPEGAADAGAKPRFGLLSLVVRERHHWTAPLLGRAAAANRWTRVPGPPGSANVPYLTGLFVLAFALAAVRGLLVNALAYLSAAVTLEVVTKVRRAVYFHTYRMGALTMQTVGTAEAADLLTRRVEEVGDALHARLSGGLRYPLTAGLLVGLIVLVNFWLALSFLALAALVWLVGGQVAAHFRREGRLGDRQSAAALGLLQESMSLFRLVKCFQMERFNQARVERQLAESARAKWRKLRGAALAGPLLWSVVLLAGIALLYLAARGVLAGTFTTAGLAVLAVALVALAGPVAGLFDLARKVRLGREAAAAIFEFLDRRGEAAEAADAEFLPPLTTRLEFRQVTLDDPATGARVLDKLTFAVPAGASVAVVGPSAAEKRALVYLLPRFLDPTSGEVRIEDKNIRWVTHESLRAQVALVTLDDLTFTDTVANNIGVGSPENGLPRIIEAAKLAHAHQFIEKLPFGYETLIGPTGHALTPGQRYRIALARALLRDPSVLVIEEPTGPMDEDTLALLDDTLARISGNHTIIFLAQRFSTLRRVNRVFVLRNGRLDASGPHDELWAGSASYRGLQFTADADAPEPAAEGAE